MKLELRLNIHAHEVWKMLEYWIKEPALHKHEEHCGWLEDVVFHIQDPMTDVSDRLQHPPDFLFYMIYVNHVHVGFVEAFSRPFDFYGLSIDITSICIFNEYRGRGYVREALKLLVTRLFDRFPNALHISCQTNMTNRPMVNHLTDLGFIRKDSTKVGEVYLYDRDLNMLKEG